MNHLDEDDKWWNKQPLGVRGRRVERHHRVSMYGRNRILKKVREFPILGGSGAFEFEFARGHAQAETYKLNGFDVMVEYNVFIWY